MMKGMLNNKILTHLFIFQYILHMMLGWRIHGDKQILFKQKFMNRMA